MTDEEKEEKHEQLTIIGAITISIFASFFLLVFSSLMDHVIGFSMIDNYGMWAISPFILVSIISTIYGIIRSAIYYGMMSAMKQFAVDQLAEAEKNNISFTMEIPDEDDSNEVLADAGPVASEWKEVKKK